MLSVRVGRLDCDEARREEEEEDGTCRHDAAKVQRGWQGRELERRDELFVPTQTNRCLSVRNQV